MGKMSLPKMVKGIYGAYMFVCWLWYTYVDVQCLFVGVNVSCDGSGADFDWTLFGHDRRPLQKPKITIQDSETKMYDSETKMTATKTEAIQKKNVPIQKPRKERDSETKKYDSTCTIQKPKFDLETSTWLLPPLTTMLHFEHHRRSKPRQHPSDHYVAFGTSQEIHTLPPLWPLGCILNFTRDQNSSVPL